MPNLDWMLWDVAVLSTTAGVTHSLFQARENQDSSNPKHKTNMRGAGSLPTGEEFLIRKIEVFPDTQLAQADIHALVDSSYITVSVGDRAMFEAPLREVLGHNSFS